MGQIQNRFRRQTRAEKLDQLETCIREKEKEKRHNGRNQAVATRYVNLCAIGLFSLTVILNIFMLVHELVVFLVPILYLFVRCFISRHYKQKLKNSYYDVYKMREDKRLVLEDVKRNESYVVAKELLQQYGHPEDHWNSPSPMNDSPDNFGKKSEDDVNINIL